jgi:hypothetical protein
MKKLNFFKRNYGLLGLLTAIALVPFEASAYSPAAPGSAGYDFFDIVANQLINGAAGTTIGLAGYALTAIMVTMSNYKAAIGGIIGSTMFIQANNIATSFGVGVALLV